MSIILTLESFVTGTKQSTLVDESKIDELLAEATAAGRPFESATDFADALVERELVTRWQADKLLQGKYRGFVLGRYQLKKLLGKGEMSSVYLAEHIRMKRRCAIKVLPAHKVRETSYLGRFHREAEAVAQLDHPNIVRAYDVDVEEDSGAEIHFLVMEYVVGRSIEKRVVEDGPLDPIEAANLLRQAAAGVAHAHAAGLVHRDIKPGNLLIDASGTVKVLDLGLARFFKDQDRESLTIKHDEKVLGTADYLAPEQAVDSHAVDERADIYALGCTLFFALTGRPPFVEGTLVQRLLAHQTQAPPSITEFRDDCPARLIEIINQMMAKDPDDRFQTALEVEQELAVFLVENADKAWRESHVDIVANVRGVEQFLAGTAAAPNNGTNDHAADETANGAATDHAAVPNEQSHDDQTNSDHANSESGSSSRKKNRKRKRNRGKLSGSNPSVSPTAAVDSKPVIDAVASVASIGSNDVGSGVDRMDGAIPSASDVVTKPGDSFIAPVRSAFQRSDKQLLAIVGLLIVAIGFAASVAYQVRATDSQDSTLEESTNVEATNADPDQVSPILNDRDDPSSIDFGLPDSTTSPNGETRSIPPAGPSPGAE